MHLTKSRKTPLMLQKSDFMLGLHRLLTLVHVPWLLLYMMINCTLQILAIVKVSYFRSKKTASSTTLMSVRRSVRIRNTSKRDWNSNSRGSQISTFARVVINKPATSRAGWCHRVPLAILGLNTVNSTSTHSIRDLATDAQSHTILDPTSLTNQTSKFLSFLKKTNGWCWQQTECGTRFLGSNLHKFSTKLIFPEQVIEPQMVKSWSTNY